MSDEQESRPDVEVIAAVVLACTIDDNALIPPQDVELQSSGRVAWFELDTALGRFNVTVGKLEQV